MAQIPSFYDPDRIGTLFYPDVARIAAEAASAGLPPASQDAQDVHLLLIDMQVDFCHPNGNLYVPGALGDLRRTIEFIYRNAECITHITCSLDSHLPSQIFTPAWWVDAEGRHPAPFTIITADDVRKGTWRPRFWPEASLRYVEELEQGHKKLLCIWPYHVQIGSPGHVLDPELWSAVFWHSLARQVDPVWVAKGDVPLTEHYSILQPEVPVPDQSGGGLNQGLLKALAKADIVLIAGEAESHCVLETMEDLVEAFGGRRESLNKIYLLQDCTSPVQHPEIDFHALATARLAEFQAMGLHLINSTDPLPF